MNDIKSINVSNDKPIKTSKEIKSRIVTQHNNWKITYEEYDPIIQLNLLVVDSSDNIACQTMKKQIQTKINGYKSQDIIKGIFSIDSFITLENILVMLCKCELRCFYCKDMVKVLYKQVREPKQWTLERIDNQYGHNNNNVEIACLSCNLRRGTMYHERYRFTKQLVINKLL